MFDLFYDYDKNYCRTIARVKLVTEVAVKLLQEQDMGLCRAAARMCTWLLDDHIQLFGEYAYRSAELIG